MDIEPHRFQWNFKRRNKSPNDSERTAKSALFLDITHCAAPNASRSRGDTSKVHGSRRGKHSKFKSRRRARCWHSTLSRCHAGRRRSCINLNRGVHNYFVVILVRSYRPLLKIENWEESLLAAAPIPGSVFYGSCLMLEGSAHLSA